jgi:hypothetical protein
MPKRYYQTGPVIDPAPVNKKVREIVEHATELTAFEAAFVKSVAHAAARFSTSFRCSPKQLAVLDAIWTKRALPAMLDAKVTKG